jgi:hypothetical protein
LLSTDVLLISTLVLVMIASRAYDIATRRIDPKQWREQMWSDLLWTVVIIGLYCVDRFVWHREQDTATPSEFLWALIAALPTLLFGPRLIRWAFRGRWAGPLLVELPRFHDKLFTRILAVVLPFPVLLFDAAFRGQTVWILTELSLFSVGFDLFILAGLLQLRQQGIVQSGQLIKWANVVSCIFDQETRRLEIKTARPARPDYAIAARPDREIRIYIPYRLAEQIEAMLRSHLPEKIQPPSGTLHPASA